METKNKQTIEHGLSDEEIKNLKADAISDRDNEELTSQQEDLMLERDFDETEFIEIVCSDCGDTGRFTNEEDGFLICACGGETEK